jgi:hypothetical protein
MANGCSRVALPSTTRAVSAAISSAPTTASAATAAVRIGDGAGQRGHEKGHDGCRNAVLAELHLLLQGLKKEDTQQCLPAQRASTGTGRHLTQFVAN